jgi:hypothetical protein
MDTSNNLQVKSWVPATPSFLLKDSFFCAETEFSFGFGDAILIDFLNALSRKILTNPHLKSLPPYTALAFWLRKSNVEKMLKENEFLTSQSKFKTVPIGKVLHIAPSNVDTIFLYSVAISLLCGNKNLVRLSEKTTEVLADLLTLIDETLQDKPFQLLNNYLQIISYGHDQTVSETLCAKADARVVWGGDATVQTFKNFQTPPRCRDIFFADRLSFSIIKASVFNSISNEEQILLAEKLYKDSYVFDQKACSSPQSIFFLGDEDSCQTAENKLYDLLKKESLNYTNDVASLVGLKLNQAASDAIENADCQIKFTDTRLVFEQHFSANIVMHSCGGGYFFTGYLKDLREISPLINKKIQTISYFGLDEDDINKIVTIVAGKGVDRIVPIGQSLAFDYIWDGLNLFETLSQKISISR